MPYQFGDSVGVAEELVRTGVSNGLDRLIFWSGVEHRVCSLTRCLLIHLVRGMRSNPSIREVIVLLVSDRRFEAVQTDQTIQVGEAQEIDTADHFKCIARGHGIKPSGPKVALP